MPSNWPVDADSLGAGADAEGATADALGAAADDGAALGVASQAPTTRATLASNPVHRWVNLSPWLHILGVAAGRHRRRYLPPRRDRQGPLPASPSG